VLERAAAEIAELLREQAAEAGRREQIEQELRLARLIQQRFLPAELPRLPGWRLDAWYRPAREVGGDFYDFFDLPDGRLGIVVGDVTGFTGPDWEQEDDITLVTLQRLAPARGAGGGGGAASETEPESAVAARGGTP
jgi:hypothetical protein